LLHGAIFAENREQGTEDRGQRTEDREQRTEDRGQRTENRGQRTGNRGQGIVVSACSFLMVNGEIGKASM
jgi:hypothetical protein